MIPFPTRPANRRRAEAVETLGSKPKFWFRDGEKRWLFKADDRGTGEDWAEVVACHLSTLRRKSGLWELSKPSSRSPNIRQVPGSHGSNASQTWTATRFVLF